MSNAHFRTSKAIFGPTPGKANSASIVFGTSSSYSSRRICVAFRMFFVLTLWKPTGLINSWNSSSLVSSRIRLTDRPRAFRAPMTAAFTVSFVWEDSMSDTRTWYLRSFSDACGSASRSQPIVSTTAVRSLRSSLMRRHSSLKPGGMVTTGVVALARFALGGAARGGRFFGAMSDVLRTAQSASTLARRVRVIVLVIFCSLLLLSCSPSRCSLSQKLVTEAKSAAFSVSRAVAWPQ